MKSFTKTLILIRAETSFGAGVSTPVFSVLPHFLHTYAAGEAASDSARDRAGSDGDRLMRERGGRGRRRRRRPARTWVRSRTELELKLESGLGLESAGS